MKANTANPMTITNVQGPGSTIFLVSIGMGVKGTLYTLTPKYTDFYLSSFNVILI